MIFASLNWGYVTNRTPLQSMWDQSMIPYIFHILSGNFSFNRSIPYFDSSQNCFGTATSDCFAFFHQIALF